MKVNLKKHKEWSFGEWHGDCPKWAKEMRDAKYPGLKESVNVVIGPRDSCPACDAKNH